MQNLLDLSCFAARRNRKRRNPRGAEMARPKPILELKKARIITSGGTLPKIMLSRQEFWQSLNDLLGRCLVGCGIDAEIVVGEADDSFFKQGRPTKFHSRPWQTKNNP